MRYKIGIVGAGNVGGTTAQRMAERNYADIVLPCSAYLRGEYGYDGIYLGVPVKLGRRGVEEIVQITLSASERRALDKSAESVRELLRVMEPAP